MDRRQSGIRPRGNSIQLEFTYRGKRCRETIKLSPTQNNLAYAAKKKAAIEYQIEIGQFDYLEHFPSSKKGISFSTNPGKHITVKEQLNKWLLVAQKRCAFSTVRGYSIIINAHLEPQFGHFTLSELKASHIEEWITTLDISNKRINNILSPLRQAMEIAYEDDLIAKNPLHRFKNLKINTREPKPFSKVEIQSILNELEGQALNFIKFAFWTGMRTGELIGLRWKDIDFEKRKIRVAVSIVNGKEKEPKTRNGKRAIDLNSHALEALKSQKPFTFEFNHRVFHHPRSNRPELNDQNIRKSIWQPALERANIEYRSPYQTRHTFASMMLMAGQTPFWLSRQMGHASPTQTFQSYARWIEDN